jgi:hypothetical protein
MATPTPLLDFFRRGEASPDVRLLAARGVVAPRAHEQVAILMLLVDDEDGEVRETASETLRSIPVEALRAYLARADVGEQVREFFAARGVRGGHVPAAANADEPLFIDDDGDEIAVEGQGDSSETLLQKLQKMPMTERMKAAMRGTRETRAVLIRDPNKIVAVAVLSSPKVSEAEVESFAKMATVSEDVLRTIAMNRAWLKNYSIVLALAKNSKTPIALSLNLLNRLTDRDVAGLSIDRNVPDPVRIAARRRVTMGKS